MVVEFLESFSKDIDALSSEEIKRKVILLIERVESISSLSELQNVKKLAGFKSAYRIRLGDYRVEFFLSVRRFNLHVFFIEKIFIVCSPNQVSRFPISSHLEREIGNLILQG